MALVGLTVSRAASRRSRGNPSAHGVLPPRGLPAGAASLSSKGRRSPGDRRVVEMPDIGRSHEPRDDWASGERGHWALRRGLSTTTPRRDGHGPASRELTVARRTARSARWLPSGRRLRYRRIRLAARSSRMRALRHRRIANTLPPRTVDRDDCRVDANREDRVFDC